MAGKMPESWLTEIVEAVKRDDSDRSDWKSRQTKWRDIRLCNDTRPKLPYPGAPDLREPIVDDMVTQLTSTEMSIMWSARTLAVFHPRTADGMRYKRMVEVGFDTMLRQTLQLRSKLENLFDLKNERGMAVVKMIETELPDGTILCDLLPLEAEKVIVPKFTTYIRKAERICHEVTISIREFRVMAEKKGWAGAGEIIDRLKGKKSDANSGEPVVEGATEVGSSVADIVLWEIYHYGANGVSKYRTIVARDLPEEIIDSSEWKWPDRPKLTGAIDPLTGMPETTTVKGQFREWPFVQIRYSNRTLRYYDIRGCTEKLQHDQNIAQANLNAKGVMMDFYCKPFIKGLNGKQFKWRPGESLPDGAEIVQMPRLDAIFDYNVDLARAAAARRIGAPSGALSSADRTRDTKTAKEVSISAMQNNLSSSDNVERFAEPLAELFTMMWDWCRNNRPRLTGISGYEFIEIPDAAFDIPFVVQAGISGRSANADLILQQLITLTQMLSMYPAFGQVIRPVELAKLFFDQIDPKITDLIVLDPQAAGPAGQAPIETQVGQIMQLLKGGKNAEGVDEQGLVEQVMAQQQYLTQIAQSDAADTGDKPQ
jgi:hypothetical protein